jgi:hypothetical protein
MLKYDKFGKEWFDQSKKCIEERKNALTVLANQNQGGLSNKLFPNHWHSQED